MESSGTTAISRQRAYRAAKWMVLLLLAVATLLLAWRIAGPPAVTVVRPTRGPAMQAVYATGSVEASVTVRIAPQLAGRLVALLADEGDVVTAGQLLARLDDSDLRASLGDEQAKLRYAEAHLQRLQALFNAGFATLDQLDQARASRDSARATSQHIAEQIKFMTLRASVAGRIIRRDGEVGDFIPSNQPVFYLAQSGAPLRIAADVDEEDVAAVRVGQRSLITADAFPGRVFEGRVVEITPKGDPLSRVYRVRVVLPPNTPLMIGMTTEANIILAQRAHALLVPTAALNGNRVWLVRDGRALAQRLTLGAKGQGRTEVLAGLSDSDQIIVQPPADLKQGQKVRAMVATAAESSR
jgi:RND family efflux transporter MFP subunit